ncbi:formyltransferase family protein [Schleiferiaceae bacterium]|nr:formyltransferase family protein [Schleiferiaceae bacterium]
MGILPMYRGMDVIEWPILLEDWKNLGITIHFMDKGVDTGDILKVHYIPQRKGDTIKTIRLRFEPVMVEQLSNVVVDLLYEKIKGEPQNINDGKQFFVMSKRLQDITKNKLNRYQTG